MIPQPANNPPSRGIFLKNLALGLMKKYFRAKAKIVSLQNDIKIFLSVNYALPS